LGLLSKKKNGDMVVDFQRRKLLQRLWPKVQGGSVNIRFASQEVVNGAVSWGSVVSFDPTTQRVTDNDPLSGAALGFEVSKTGQFWRLDGYKMQIAPLGEF
jgi:hypothetical protein